jgi:hypothetical protein
MKNTILTILLFISLNSVGQTILKDRKQELRIERVIQNSEETYKVYFHASYLVVGSKAMMNLFLEELLSIISTQKTTNTYVGNTSVKYEAFDDEIQVSAKTSQFRLTRKQIIKLKSKLL